MASRDFGQEPRQVFVNRLIYITTQLEQDIYVSRASIIKVLPSIKGVISLLTKKDKKALEEVLKKINTYRTSKSPTRQEIEAVFSDLMNYLHDTHLKEISWIKPKFDSPKLEYEKETPEEAQDQNK